MQRRRRWRLPLELMWSSSTKWYWRSSSRELWLLLLDPPRQLLDPPRHLLDTPRQLLDPQLSLAALQFPLLIKRGWLL